MPNMNRVFLMGNLTRDPELRYTPGGQAVCTLGMAVNNKFNKDGESREETLFVDVNVWAKTAENCAEYLSKGSPIMVEGRLKFRTWEGQDGAKRSKIDVTAFNVQFLSFGKGQGTKQKDEGQASDMQPPMTDDDVPF